MYKIILADDESIECMALERMIAEGLDCCQVIRSVQNGMDLLAAAEEDDPDIVIVDVNMPGLTGLDAIEILSRKKKGLKIIINTAYSEFSYIKRAMNCHAANYVLKPARQEELFGTLREVCAQLDEEKRLAEKSLRFEQIEGQHLMASLLLEEVDWSELARLQEELERRYTGGVCLYRKGGAQEPDVSRVFSDCLQKKLGEDTLLLTRWHQDGQYCLVLTAALAEDFRPRLPGLLRETAACLPRPERDTIQLGVSSWKETLEEFVQAVKECRRALPGRNTPGIYFFSPRSNPGLVKTEQLLAVVEDSYRKRGWDRAIAVFLEKLHAARQKQIPFPVFRAGGILCLMRLLSAESGAKGGWYGTNLMRWEEWMALERWEDMEARLRASAELPHREQELNRYVHLARAYMEERYAEDLSLDMVAEYAGITSFYMSRLFRKELGVNFTEFLTDLRMGKALELLWNHAYSIRAISEQTGYTSLSYFYKVFKKYYGITAGEFVSCLK